MSPLPPTPRLVLLSALLAWVPCEARAAFNDDYAGTSGGQFLKLPLDARSAALGSAVGAAAEDSTAVHWNPAGLASLAERHVTATFAAVYQDVRFGFLTAGQPIESLVAPRRRELAPSGLGTLAVGLLYLNTGSLEEVDNTGAATGGTFSPADTALMAGWGGSFTRALDLGLSVKLVRAKIQRTATTGAADAGLRLKLRFGELPYTLSASVHNMGGQLKFDKQADRLPLQLRAGGAAQVMPSWLIAAQASMTRDAGPAFGVGTELLYGLDARITGAFRAGYASAANSGDLDGLAGLSLGGGARFQNAGFDYAWLPYGALGDSHRFSLSYRF